MPQRVPQDCGTMMFVGCHGTDFVGIDWRAVGLANRKTPRRVTANIRSGRKSSQVD